MDGGLLLLEGLAQIFVRNAELDQFPVELRGLILPLLEGRLRPLERGTLLLERTQRLFSRQALPLERSLGLGKSSTLLLEPGLRLLARSLLLTELFLHRGERGGLVRQGRPQPLGFLSPLLGLTLLSPRPLEGRAVLLELSASGNDLGLPRRRDGARPGQVFTRSAQRVIPLHQRRPHPLNRGGVYRGLGILFRRLVQQRLGPVRQPPVWRPQGLDEGVEGVVLPPVPAEISVEAVEGVVSLPGLALQILPPTGEARGEGVRENANAEQSERRNYGTQRKTTNLEDAPRGTAVDPQRLVQRPVERSAVIAELLPQLLLHLGLDEVGRRCAGALPLLLRMRRGATRRWKSSARRRGPSAVSRAPQRLAAIVPHHE
jgi:hypothetical protein